MSLPLRAIDRLFERLTLTYGRRFIDQWDMLGDDDIVKLKTLWSHELGIYANRLDAIAWALENLPTRAPNLIEFKALCHMAPRPQEPLLPEPQADPERMRQELAKLGEIKQQAITGNRGVEWAQMNLRRYRMGERVNSTVLRFSREALRARGLTE